MASPIQSSDSQDGADKYDLQVNIAYLEKKEQDQTQDIFLANEQIIKMREAWDADKAMMLDYQNKL